MSTKLSTINEVVPPFEAEEISRDKLLDTLRTMKATRDQETHIITDSVKANLATDKEIAGLEAALIQAKQKKLQSCASFVS